MLQDSDNESGVLGEEDLPEYGAGPRELPHTAREWMALHSGVGMSAEAQTPRADDAAGGDAAEPKLPLHIPAQVCFIQ